VTVEIVHRFYSRERIITFPAQELAYVRPVLLLDVSIVIFFVRSSSGEVDVVLGTPGAEMPIDELRAVIRIEAQETKGQGGSNLLQSLQHRRSTPPQQGPRFRPAGVDIGDVEGMGKLSTGRVAGMRDQVHLRESWNFHVPMLSPHRDLMLEQGARPGATVNPSLPLQPLDSQAAVHLPRTDLQQLLLDSRRHAKPLAHPRQPERQEGF